MLVLACPGVSTNCVGLTNADMLPCRYDSVVFPPPDYVVRSVPVVPMVLERYPVILIF